uniref:Uncharacterized protein n=1 Tax=Arundo donax TaxID=35708 RepID=A0A0A9F5Y7_ARUDO
MKWRLLLFPPFFSIQISWRPSISSLLCAMKF